MDKDKLELVTLFFKNKCILQIIAYYEESKTLFFNFLDQKTEPCSLSQFNDEGIKIGLIVVNVNELAMIRISYDIQEAQCYCEDD